MMAESTLGVLVFPAVEELDFVGPWELFGLWHAYGDGPRCRTIGTEPGPIRARHGLRVVPDMEMAEASSLTHLLVPGGAGAEPAAQDAAVTEFVARQAEAGATILSVCTGVRVLHGAGLLDGRRVTTHHSALDDVRGWAGVTAVDDRRYVRDGAVWTAAGISAGLDLAMAVIAEEGGEAVAARVRREAEYFPAESEREG